MLAITVSAAMLAPIHGSGIANDIGRHLVLWHNVVRFAAQISYSRITGSFQLSNIWPDPNADRQRSPPAEGFRGRTAQRDSAAGIPPRQLRDRRQSGRG